MTRALVLHDAALADGTSGRLRTGVSPRVEDGLIASVFAANGGTLLGHDHAGRVEEGLPADLVLVHGDPLSDARALWRVWSVYQRGVRVA